MATLYVQNIPDGLYEALRRRARQHRKSIAAEVLSLLEENIPTALELKSRKEFLRRAERFRSRKPRSGGPFTSSEEIQREDRSR
jgi:plasmid stability protein